ncbi:MAG: 30S ribosomal protein S27ae [Candidatus Methanoperedens sp.]|nr:30S ribosomal protein S27ae [Candidatus Methanoperedens sp. BLZ2]MCX9078259.1 30S ribosomal protein S27ae [Candidatus Methanoperedens sp.]MCX9087787.1 30S ribosomal protein S27ae [Candidatus Methanoperedens sp.]
MKKKKNKGISMAINKFYKISGNKAEKVKPSCPRCGPGIFLGEHKNRNSCGKCGYTEFKK